MDTEFSHTRPTVPARGFASLYTQVLTRLSASHGFSQQFRIHLHSALPFNTHMHKDIHQTAQAVSHLFFCLAWCLISFGSVCTVYHWLCSCPVLVIWSYDHKTE